MIQRLRGLHPEQLNNGNQSILIITNNKAVNTFSILSALRTFTAFSLLSSSSLSRSISSDQLTGSATAELLLRLRNHGFRVSRSSGTLLKGGRFALASSFSPRTRSIGTREPRKR